jgi:hypothetical protein
MGRSSRHQALGDRAWCGSTAPRAGIVREVINWGACGSIAPPITVDIMITLSPKHGSGCDSMHPSRPLNSLWLPSC